jgi:hypothetical protein
MAETEARGVQHDARSGGAITAVARVPEDGHPRFREVNADLVLAPGARVGLDEQAARERLQHLEVGHGRA